MPFRPGKLALGTWLLLSRAGNKFLRIDGLQRAAAFAYSAFFALFPLLILFAACASLFVNRDAAGHSVVAYVEKYIPLTLEARHYIFDTVYGIIKARGQAGAAAFLILIWVSVQFFATLVQATNRAWGTGGYKWWHLPLTSLGLLAVMTIAVLTGISLAVLGRMIHVFFAESPFLAWLHGIMVLVLPWLIVFAGLTIFYKMAPRRRTRISEVWGSALLATFLLQAAQTLFLLYIKKYPGFNALYGTFGSVMALLLWIYLSGCIFIFGACLCSAKAELREAAGPA